MKKLSHSTYFQKLGLLEEEKEYHSITTQEEMVAFFHKVLDKYAAWPGVCFYIYTMMSFSVNRDINRIIPRSL